MQQLRQGMQPTVKVGLLALLLTAAAAAAAAAGPQEDFWLETRDFANTSMIREKGCSQLKALDWVRTYMQWHAEQLKNPTQAKFLLYLCGQPKWEGASPSVNVPMPRFCSGLGDRLRGMVEMLRMAAYSQRVLLFHWSHPMKLEEVFDPADIDWRVKKEYALDAVNAPIVRWDNAEPGPKSLRDGTWRELYGSARLVIMRLKQRDDYGHLFKYWPHFKGGSSEERSCAYRMLFKPTALVEQRVAEQRTKLMGDAEKPYVAVHLRLGGFQGEMSDINRFDHFKGLLSALVCVRQMAEAKGIAAAPVLLLTDNELLRRLVAGRYFGEAIVGPSMGKRGASSAQQGAGIASTSSPRASPRQLARVSRAPKRRKPPGPVAGKGSAATLVKQEPSVLTSQEDIPPAHLDKPAALASHIASFVDVVLLSRASCFLRSPSGFSNTAWYLGFNRCSNTVQKCMDAVVGQDKLLASANIKVFQQAKRIRRHTMQGRRQPGLAGVVA